MLLSLYITFIHSALTLSAWSERAPTKSICNYSGRENYSRLRRKLPIFKVLPPLLYIYIYIIQVIERSSFFVLKTWPASISKRQIKVDFMKFSLSCSCRKSCTFHKPFLGPKIATEALILTKLKFHLKKNFVG